MATITINQPTPTEGVRYVDPDEFIPLGLLQEVNRLFFHPRGMALEVQPETIDGRFLVVGVWDDRDDPETGYAPGVIDPEKVDAVERLVRNDPQEIS